MLRVFVWDWDTECDFCEFDGTEEECNEFISENGLQLLNNYRTAEEDFYCER